MIRRIQYFLRHAQTSNNREYFENGANFDCPPAKQFRRALLQKDKAFCPRPNQRLASCPTTATPCMLPVRLVSLHASKRSSTAAHTAMALFKALALLGCALSSSVLASERTSRSCGFLPKPLPRPPRLAPPRVNPCDSMVCPEVRRSPPHPQHMHVYMH